MACLTTEKSAPLTQQKRCSLPGPMGSLNLYATHQQRRLSERGLMIYRPNKPDIDLIRDFTASSKKSTPSFLHDRDPSCSGYPQQQRRHSTAVNLMASSSAVATPSTSTGWPGNYTTERRHSSIIPGASSSPNFLPNFSSSSSNNNNSSSSSSGQSSSKYQIVKPSLHSPPASSLSPLASQSSTVYTCGNQAGSSSSMTCGSVTDSSGGGGGNKGLNSSSLKQQNPSTSGCRKVRLRIHKNPGAKDKFFELTPIFGRPTIGSTGDAEDDEDRASLLRKPHCDNRRFSDSAATIRQPPHICITPDGPVGRYNKDSGIVCSTGDLLTLKCLTSSAQEIRFADSSSSSSQVTFTSDPEKPPPQSLGSRSRSFDATIAMARKGPGSSWFSRRHQPIAVKLPLPINSPTISSPGDTRYFPGNAAGILRTPILTITNENASKSELIEIPSPPAASPASSRNSPEEKTKVAWDRNGFVLDAAVLGIAIENHLRKVDMRRRATFSAIYQPPPTYLETKVPTRARSASACVIPISCGLIGEEGVRSTSSRRSSLSSSGPGGRLLCWERSGAGGGGGGGGGNMTVVPTATTTVSYTGGTGAGQSSTYETYLHRLPMSMAMSATVYMNNMDSPSSDSFLNFRATEDDIEEENLAGEEDEEEEEDDVEAEERKAFLPNQKRTTASSSSSSGGAGGTGAAQQPKQRNSSSSSSSSAVAGSMATGSAAPFSHTTASQPNEGNHSGSSQAAGSNNSSRGNGMSICSAIRDFILQTIRS